MGHSVVIVVSGPPGTGKTTLGRRLAAEFALPFLYKDRIKEALFDTLGVRDRAWSRTLGAATMEVLWAWLETELVAGRSCLVESNFHPDFATPRFRTLRARYAYQPFEIQCTTEPAVLRARFQARAESGTRHPGHGDWDLLAELDPVFARGRTGDLALGGPIVHLDTTDFAAIDYDGLCAAIRPLLAASGSLAHL